MNNHEEIPAPEESGSDGSQVESDSTTQLVKAKPLEGVVLANTINGLTAANTRVFGSEATSALVAGATAHLASELQYAKREIETLRLQNEATVKELSESNIKKAVLEERISSYRSNRHLGNLGLVVGATLLNVSFQLFKNEQSGYGSLALLIGVILLLFGWVSAPKGGDK